jgi:hypothetical protein
MAGLIRTPRGIGLFSTRAQHDNRLRTFPKLIPLRPMQRHFAFDRSCCPLNSHRQAHQPQPAEPQHETECCQPW